jgi:hypothetical protein
LSVREKREGASGAWRQHSEESKRKGKKEGKERIAQLICNGHFLFFQGIVPNAKKS